MTAPHPLKGGLDRLVDRALEPRDPFGLVLDLVEVIQQRGLLGGVLKCTVFTRSGGLMTHPQLATLAPAA